MVDSSTSKDQQHPQYNRDRPIVQDLLTKTQPTDYHLVELARLMIRYQGFPGARDLQGELARVLRQWNLTEEQLFAQTRQIHATAQVYKQSEAQQEDWS